VSFLKLFRNCYNITIDTTFLHSCSGPWKPGSRCHLRKARGLLGKPKGGVRNLEWGGDEKGEISLRATWDQFGQDRIMPKEGFQVSKGETEGGVNRKLAREVKKGNCAITCIVICICVYNNCLNV
jgi:hypothetical protein